MSRVDSNGVRDCWTSKPTQHTGRNQCGGDVYVRRGYGETISPASLRGSWDCSNLRNSYLSVDRGIQLYASLDA